MILLNSLFSFDFTNYPQSGFSDIHKRIGEEINELKIKQMLKKCVIMRF